MKMTKRTPILRTLLTAALLLALLTGTALAAESTDHYGRTALSTLNNGAALVYAYDAVASGVEASASEITVFDGTNPISVDEIALVMDAYRRDYAHHFWLGDAYSYTYNQETGNVYDLIPGYSEGENFVAGYLLSGTELTAAKAAYTAAEDAILDGIDENWTDFEIELYLHDTLAAMVEYTEATHAHNAYGALVEGKAVCEGYAEALQHLLHRAGIQSFLMTGRSRGEGHEWNVVNIDGKWHHVDLTWDDQGSELFHAYFNVSDAILAEDHTIDETPYALPVCDSMAANYFTVRGGSVTEFDAEQIGSLMLAQGSLTVHVYLTGDETVPGYITAFESEDNLQKLIEITGATHVTGYSYAALGHEIVLHIEGELTLPEGISAAITAQQTGRITVTVRAYPAQTGSLFIAVYDGNDRMIGITEALSASLTPNGSPYTVTFAGTADLVKVFTPDSSYVPTAAAIPLAVE